MKTFTIDDIAEWGSCYPPEDTLSPNWSGTALDMLNVETVEFADKVWCIMRTDLIDEKWIRYFAAYCANLREQTNEQAITCIQAGKDYADGLITFEQRHTHEWHCGEQISLAENQTEVANLRCAQAVSLPKIAEVPNVAIAWCLAGLSGQDLEDRKDLIISYLTDLFNENGKE